ncbi:MAG TPA: hypothetical protein VIX59_13480 [Candidatus Binataceae bacterium]
MIAYDAPEALNHVWTIQEYLTRCSKRIASAKNDDDRGDAITALDDGLRDLDRWIGETDSHVARS